MLQNPVYAGGLRIGETPKGDFFRTHGGKEVAASEVEGESEPVISWDCHQGIVSRDLWDCVQGKIRRKFKKRGTPRNHGPYALSGVIHCGNCGQPMYGSVNEKGVNIYRCHRPEVGPNNTCGYWIAYEKAILPFLFRRFLPDLRQHIDTRAAARQVPVREGGELEGLRERLKRLDAQLERGRERFLEATADVSPGLHATLQRWEAERRDVQGRIDALTAGEGTNRIVLLVTKTLEVAFDPDKILVPTGGPQIVGAGGVSREVYSLVPAPVLRESFKRINAHVSVWFRRKTKGRGYDVDKVRVQAEVGAGVCYEYSSNAAS
jgi:hypothetical protein